MVPRDIWNELWKWIVDKLILPSGLLQLGAIEEPSKTECPAIHTSPCWCPWKGSGYSSISFRSSKYWIGHQPPKRDVPNKSVTDWRAATMCNICTCTLCIWIYISTYILYIKYSTIYVVETTRLSQLFQPLETRSYPGLGLKAMLLCVNLRICVNICVSVYPPTLPSSCYGRAAPGITAGVGPNFAHPF